ncbi:MAG TPA: DUF433 domain-containing protein [Blastocatellia bacterium]|nr:DUF433 domain-containing protein [Blastocatellia bacterium]
MQTAITNHIYLDEEGQAWIDDTNIKVIEVVLDKIAYGWSPEEIHDQHSHLSLAQIHSALSYYYDHQAEIDAEIEQQDKEIEALMEKAQDSPLKKWLRSVTQEPDKRIQIRATESSPQWLEDIVDKWVNGLSPKQIAQETGKPIKTIYQILKQRQKAIATEIQQSSSGDETEKLKATESLTDEQ